MATPELTAMNDTNIQMPAAALQLAVETQACGGTCAP